MHRTTILALALALAAATTTSASQLLKRRDDDPDAQTGQGPSSAYRACYPLLLNAPSETKTPDLSAPCNLVAAIQAQCAYGPRALQEEEFLCSNPGEADADAWPSSHNSNNPGAQQQQQTSPENERTCICQSQITDAARGCTACLEAHEGPEFAEAAAGGFAGFVPEVMWRYCDVEYTPTGSFVEFAREAWDAYGNGGGKGEDEASSSTSTSSTYSDVIGTSTDVSLYYTMSVTRSDAYDLAVPTGSNGNVTYTSTRTSDGQIVPTAVDARGSGSGSSSVSGSGGKDASASATSSADSGAATAYAGAGGLLAVVALAAVGL